MDRDELAKILSILYKRGFTSKYKDDIEFTVNLIDMCTDEMYSVYMMYTYKYKDIKPFSIKFGEWSYKVDYNNPNWIIELFNRTGYAIVYEEWYVNHYIEECK